MPVSVFSEKIAKGFAATVEIAAPKGADCSKAVEGALLLREAGADAVDIGDNTLARMHMSPVAAARIVKQEAGIEAIIHLTCRDRNVLALQSELLGAHALGIRDVIALGGDPPEKGDHPKARGVFEVDAVRLIELALGLNKGEDRGGNALEAPTGFNIIAAANPNAKSIETELEKIDAKLAAGAHMLMTQPIFEAEKFEKLVEGIGKKVPVIVGLLPITSLKNARFLNENVGGISVPAEVVKRFEGKDVEEARAEGVRIAVEIYHEVRKKASGVYLMPQFKRYEAAAGILRGIRSLYSEVRC
jgi:homocysteine S-methyltransferase